MILIALTVLLAVGLLVRLVDAGSTMHRILDDVDLTYPPGPGVPAGPRAAAPR